MSKNRKSYRQMVQELKQKQRAKKFLIKKLGIADEGGDKKDQKES